MFIFKLSCVTQAIKQIISRKKSNALYYTLLNIYWYNDKLIYSSIVIITLGSHYAGAVLLKIHNRDFAHMRE